MCNFQKDIRNPHLSFDLFLHALPPWPLPGDQLRENIVPLHLAARLAEEEDLKAAHTVNFGLFVGGLDGHLNIWEISKNVDPEVLSIAPIFSFVVSGAHAEFVGVNAVLDDDEVLALVH